jgi:hypothetical protein
MVGEKVTSFPEISASAVSASDVIYIVNGGASRKITLTEFVKWSIANGLVGTVNGRTGTVTLSASDVGLGNVPNIYPITSITAGGITLVGDIVLTTADGLTTSVASATKTITIGVGSLKIPWGSMTGSISNQTDLAAALTNVGVQLSPRYMGTPDFGYPVSATIPVTGGTVQFLAEDYNHCWLDIDCPAHVTVNIPLNLAPNQTYIGKMLEVRQNNSAGSIAIGHDGGVTMNEPYGGGYTNTYMVGQRIQLVCYDTNKWEYR